MPENLHVEREAAKIVGYPINLQSLLQTLVLIGSLVGGIVYAAQRITTVENKQEFLQQILQEQKDLLKELRDDQRRSLENQKAMREQLIETERRRR